MSKGRIDFAGEDVTGLATWRRVRLGMAHTPEGRSVFATLDVEDNLRLTFVRALGRKGAGEALDRAYARFIVNTSLRKFIELRLENANR